MGNSNLANAKKAKNDEFYTQFNDIQKEVSSYIEYNLNVFKNKTILLPCDDPEWSNFTKFFAQNFDRFGIKKLISTSYASDSKNYKTDYKPTVFEKNNPQYDKTKTKKNGKIFTLTRDKTGDGKVDVNDLEWKYLVGSIPPERTNKIAQCIHTGLICLLSARGGRSGIIFSPSLENFHDPGSAISPAGEIKPPPFDSPTRAKQFARSSGHDKNTLFKECFYRVP